MKKISDYSKYQNILPYDSEIFGVYQPMIGWKSKRIQQRIDKGFRADLRKVRDQLFKGYRGNFEMVLNERGMLDKISRLHAGSNEVPRKGAMGSFVIENLTRELPPLERYDERIWERLIDEERIKTTLNREVIPSIMEWYRGAQEPRANSRVEQTNALVAEQLQRESAVASYVLHLKQTKQFEALKQLFYKPGNHWANLQKLLSFKDPLDYMDPFKDFGRAGLSPIGIVHLFRQYFFEFDTFLGPAVGHVWLSPGSSVELVEVSTRRTLVERTLETSLETTLRTEKSLTEEDELSQAVKEDNKSDTKFGMNATANQSWIGGSASASASMDMANTQSKAREVSHKHMRQQTEKISTEIRKNYKSTFRTVTETTDTSSKRYVLNNTTPDLLNYEMRRKMRQVGVQVQDIGTYLCWQTYVDDPGRQLGIAKMVHLAKGPEVGETPPPEAIPMPQAVTTELSMDIPFVPKTEDTLPEDDMDEVYREGKEVNLDDNEGEPEQIQWHFGGFRAQCDQPGYEYGEDGFISFDYGGNDIRLQLDDVDEVSPGSIRFSVKVKHVNFRNVSPLRVIAKITWQPTKKLRGDVTAQNDQKISEFNEKTRMEFEQAFVEAARDRINKMSRIESRKYEDLREEERIVVYRCLIQDMLTKGLPMPDDRTRHVVSELLNTIFDIDKMLYFVAPEWWRPRLHQSHQGLGGIRKPSSVEPAPSVASGSVYTQIKGKLSKNLVTSAAIKAKDSQIAATDTVTWGGVHDNRVDNYYITEESDPAKLGASLGWLLQLDGDNMRNAFLNAPWVKAVIPIRPGQERAAMNWLQRLHVEGTEGLDDNYVAPADELAKIPHSGPNVTIRDAINHLCDVVADKHDKSMKVGRYPGDEINDDNRVSATPVDKVYEHGFYPLQGGFRALQAGEDFEVFDQWVEVLPTDQVVPVQVAYDPKTGRQL
ncbi:MAG: hypothetical protein Q7J20_02020 [Candidatus Nitrotoga sp.]|nr:hypothetical protein [Candidatus Nitrotoga sp.]MDO9446688.1 hypothetical protein [Candidatus Nitrotoga sp.]MDP3498056.1 hypothetical protein [Candidatus Nitrotoga sp.]